MLGPLLFIIYINDIMDSLSSKIYLFADDTKLFRVIRSEDDCKFLQSDIDKLLEWSQTWLLSFHPNKCKVLHVGTDQEPTNYYLNTHQLQNVNSEKDIGVTFDCNLEFDIHISEKISKANSIFGMIRRSYKYLNKDVFLLLYKALVRSNLEYANSVWSPHKMKHIEAIENVQRRATRTVQCLKGLSYEDRLRYLNLHTSNIFSVFSFRST